MTSPRLTALIGRLRSRRARDLAAGLDLMRSIGPRYAWRRRREQAAWSGRRKAARNDVYRAIWADAAAELGATVRDLPDGRLELSRGGSAVGVRDEQQPLDDPDALRRAFDKPAVQRLLAGAGLPVPEWVETRLGELAPALGLLEEGACVVKPASTGAGHGITSGLGTPAELARAALRAARNDERILVERHVEGEMYRLLVLDGELIDAVRRLPPRVRGDGASTIGDLIAAENRRRIEAGGRLGLHLVGVDLDCVLALERRGANLGSVPAAGEVVEVKGVSSQNGPADNQTVREPVAPELRAEVVSAAQATGLRLAGVDLVARSLEQPLAKSGGAIIEVNGQPGLHHHYHVAVPEGATRVAVPVLEKLLEREREST